MDNGLLWIVAANVLLLADEDLGDFWDRALARAHATGGLFAALSVNLWRGFAQWRHGHLDDALQSLADATEQQRMWGISDVSATYAAAFTLGVLLDRGDLHEASAGLEAARTLPWLGEGGRLVREGAARLLVEEGRPADALDLLTTPVHHPEVVNPAWAPWRGLKARALAGLGRVDEAVALADEEVALLRRWGAPSSLGSSLRLRGELRGPDGTADLREAVGLLSGSRAVLDAARAQLSLGRSTEVEEAEAVALVQGALNTASACGARAVARDAAAALAARPCPDRPGVAPWASPVGNGGSPTSPGRDGRERGGAAAVPEPRDGTRRPRVHDGGRAVPAARAPGSSRRKSSCHARTPRS